MSIASSVMMHAVKSGAAPILTFPPNGGRDRSKLNIPWQDEDWLNLNRR